MGAILRGYNPTVTMYYISLFVTCLLVHLQYLPLLFLQIMFFLLTSYEHKYPRRKFISDLTNKICP